MKNRVIKFALWSIPAIALLYPVLGFAGEIVGNAMKNVAEGAQLFFVDFDQYVVSGSTPAKT